MTEVLRNERKFLLDQADLAAVRHRLRRLLHEDAHNGPQGYAVRSLYFDTEYDGDFFDKEFGVEVRRKVRLRTYDPRGSFAVLELKQKQGAQQRKRSLRLPKEDALGLIQGDYTPLLNYADPFAAECYALMHTRCYRPRTVVEYRRLAFAARENHIRITFDHRIQATSSRFDIFDPRLLTAPVMDFSQAVLEVKYNGFLLSYIKEILNTVDKTELSVSKYAMARNISYHASL